MTDLLAVAERLERLAEREDGWAAHEIEFRGHTTDVIEARKDRDAARLAASILRRVHEARESLGEPKVFITIERAAKNAEHMNGYPAGYEPLAEADAERLRALAETIRTLATEGEDE